MVQEKFNYTAQEVSELLAVSENTLRNYVNLFEKKGYQFSFSEKKVRQFNENDVMLLLKFMLLKKKSDKKLSIVAEDLLEVLQKQRKLYSEVDNSFEFQGELLEKLNGTVEIALEKALKKEKNDIRKILEEERLKTFEILNQKFKNDIETRDKEITQRMRKRLEEKSNQLLEEVKEEPKTWVQIKNNVNVKVKNLFNVVRQKMSSSENSRTKE